MLFMSWLSQGRTFRSRGYLGGFRPCLAGLLLLAGAEGVAQSVMSDEVKAGEKLFWDRCHQCHESGLRNAPLIGNKKMWKPRIAKGEEVLLQHAIHGINKMPPRGNNPDLSDEDLHNIIRYMIFVVEDA